jgi:hypothetical protein
MIGRILKIFFLLGRGQKRALHEVVQISAGVMLAAAVLALLAYFIWG